MSLERVVIFLAAGFFLLYGLAFSLIPEIMAIIVTDSGPEGISALVDFRATYGGMTIAIGIALFYLHSIHQVRACLVIIVIVLLSMAITRLVGLLVDGSGDVFMYLYLVLELLGSALAMAALRGRAGAN